MLRRTPLLLAAALVAASLAAPGSALAASALTLTPPAGPVEEGIVARRHGRASTPPEASPTASASAGATTRPLLPGRPPYEVTAGHAYADEGTYEVRVRVTVGGAEVSRGAQVVVVNAAPVLDPLPDAPAPLGEPFELTVGFSDPGTADVHDVTGGLGRRIAAGPCSPAWPGTPPPSATPTAPPGRSRWW